MLKEAFELKIIDSDKLSNILTKRIPVSSDNNSMDTAISSIMNIILSSIIKSSS